MPQASPHVPDNLNHSSQNPADDADADGAVVDSAAVDDDLEHQQAAPDSSGAAGDAVKDLGQSDGVRLNTVQPSSDRSASVPKEAEPERREDEPENFWVELRNILVLSIVLALGIRHFVAEARYIPSESMLPTLEINDRLIVEKMSYRFREPTRGDVVVFKPTDTIKAENPTFNDALIKRIVGLPGETIEVKEGKVFVNGEAIVETYIEEAPAYRWGPQEIAEDSYLVLGDNRNNSYDSHFWGFVPKKNLIGRAAVRVWPPNRLGALDKQPAFYFEVESEEDPVEPASE